MKRHLLKQIAKDWRENVWFVIELTVVFTAVWAILMMLYVQTKGLRIPRGFDPDCVYLAQANIIDESSPRHIPTDDGGYSRDKMELMKRIGENPNVESVAITNSYPYNYNFYGIQVMLADEVDSVAYIANARTATPGYIDVFKIKSLTGTSPEKLKEMLGRGEVLLSDNKVYESFGRDPKKLKGKKIILSGDSSKVYRVGDIIEKIRRNDYEDTYGGTVLMNFMENVEGDILIRIKPGREAAFIEDFKNKPELNSCRNVYLLDLKAMNDIGEVNQRSYVINIRTYVLVMLFLLVTVFLGLLGSFWFRMQQRVSEIAIRKVCGATRSQIFGRVISEGIVLLAFAAVIVSACVWPFYRQLAEKLEENFAAFAISESVAFLIVAAGVAVSLWYPARRAMNIEPAEAIKAE